VGPAGPAGSGGAVSAVFSNGFTIASIPFGDNSDTIFLGPPAAVTVAAGQKIFVTSTAALGAGGVAASSLNLFICQKAAAAPTPTQVGAGTFSLSTPANTRNHYSLSAVITGLAAGSYSVGLCGYVNGASSNWNSNEYAYTSALVLQ
jgi:hypothetical protein